MMDKIITGTLVKWYPEKNYGIIIDNYQTQYYALKKFFSPKISLIVEGLSLSFIKKEHKGRLFAIHIEPYTSITHPPKIEKNPNKSDPKPKKPMEGVLVKWFENKNYGIVRDKDYNPYYAQRQNFSKEIKKITEGMAVYFYPKEKNNKLFAIDIGTPPPIIHPPKITQGNLKPTNPKITSQSKPITNINSNQSMKGTLVKWFNDKNYGIIRDEGQQSFIAQKKYFDQNCHDIYEGMSVVFHTKNYQDKQYAINITATRDFSLLSAYPEEVFAKQNILGKVVHWNDDRGYGYILVEPCQTEVFFHISDYKNYGNRPIIGEEVKITKVLRDESKNKWHAVKVIPPRHNYNPFSLPLRKYKQSSTNTTKRLHRKRPLNTNDLEPIKIRFIIASIVVLIWLAILMCLSIPIGIAELVLSIYTFRLFMKDKQIAVEGGYRIPEKKLLFFVLIGGWCGGILARYCFKHKTTKLTFVVDFWLVVIIHIIAVGLLYAYTDIFNFLNHLLHNSHFTHHYRRHP